MAGIEKVCEVSGEYPEESWKMYLWKDNSIQVMPKYRKLFRGKKAALVFHRDEQEKRVVWWKGSCSMPLDHRKYEVVNGKYYEAVKGLGYKYLKKIKVRTRHEYTLYVPTMQGEVDGEYHGSGYDKQTIIRKMKRLVGTRNLTVK